MGEEEEEVGDGAGLEMVEEEETETNMAGSEEMKRDIDRILEKIESFTQLVPSRTRFICFSWIYLKHEHTCFF